MTPTERQQVIDALAAVNTERICDGVHHAKRDQHKIDEPCPVVQRIGAALAIMQKETVVSRAMPYALDPDCKYVVVVGKVCRKCGRVHRGITAATEATDTP